jgi:hypothetical protein
MRWVYMNTSNGGGFAALLRYPDRSSPAQLQGIPYPWLSSDCRVPKVGHTSRYDIKFSQPLFCARTCNDNLVTSITWYVWRKKVQCTTWSLHQIPYIWCYATLHINECLYTGEYSTKKTMQPLCWVFLLRDIMVEKRNGERNQDHSSKMSDVL